MGVYSTERKAAVIAKMLPPHFFNLLLLMRKIKFSFSLIYLQCNLYSRWYFYLAGKTYAYR
jgi:hypothetical protein